MVAVEFLIFVGVREFIEGGVEFAVLVEEEVVGAAVEAEGGAEMERAFFGERAGIVGAAAQSWSEEGFEFGLLGVVFLGARFGFVERGHEGAGVGSGGAEGVGEFECEFEGAVAAHGESADDAAFAPGDGGEEAVDEGEDVLGDVVFVGSAGGGFGVGVPAAGGRGHDDDEGDVGGVAFEGGAAEPGGVVVGEAVEEVEDGKGA